MNRQILIDRFIIPKSSLPEFIERMNYNRSFIRKLPGFIRDEVYKNNDDGDNLNIVTVAVWENRESINNAKSNVQEEYQKIGFNPAEFNQRLNIRQERGIYSDF